MHIVVQTTVFLPVYVLGVYLYVAERVAKSFYLSRDAYMFKLEKLHSLI